MWSREFTNCVGRDVGYKRFTRHGLDEEALGFWNPDVNSAKRTGSES
jgi:hypothetical protein